MSMILCSRTVFSQRARDENCEKEKKCEVFGVFVVWDCFDVGPSSVLCPLGPSRPLSKISGVTHDAGVATYRYRHP
jgi:hypothetical protein